MKKLLALTLVLVLACAAALADYTPSYGTDTETREYKYENEKLVLQDEDLDESHLCLTIREIIKGSISEKETIEEVSLDQDAVLRIVVQWGPDAVPEYFESIDVALSRFGTISDSLLSYKELDEYSDKIQYVYPNREALFTKDMIVDAGYGRYFDEEYIETLIK